MDTQQNDQDQLAEFVQIRMIRLKARFTGIVSGLLMAAGLFVATNWLVIKGGPNVGEHLSLLGQYFLGYSVTFLGSLIGAAYAFALGFGAGYAMSRMYNALTKPDTSEE